MQNCCTFHNVPSINDLNAPSFCSFTFFNVVVTLKGLKLKLSIFLLETQTTKRQCDENNKTDVLTC